MASTTPISRKVTFDDLLIEAGGFGRFQVIMLLLLCIPRLIIPLHFLQHIFISAVPPHHCAIPGQRNLSQEDLLFINSQRNPGDRSQEDILLNRQKNPGNLSPEDLLLRYGHMTNGQSYLRNLTWEEKLLILNQANLMNLSIDNLLLINTQRNLVNQSQEDPLFINGQKKPELLIHSQHLESPLNPHLINSQRVLTREDLLLINIPREPDGSFSSCKMYSQPQLHLITNRSQKILNGSEVQSCDQGWEYDRSTFSSTTVTQWDLVCARRRLSKLLTTAFFTGVMLGAIIFGYLSDRFGRRTILLVSFLLTLVFGGLAAGSVSYAMFIVSFALSGSSVSGLVISVIALSVEWVDTRHRIDATVIPSICWSTSSAALALLAYLVRDWRWLMVANTAPCILGVISIWWIPESARWLLAKGRVEEAQALLEKCAVKNGHSVEAIRKNRESLEALAQAGPSSENYSYIDLFRSPHLRKISICTGLVWFAVAFSYYGISLNIGNLGLDVYLTHFLYALIEFPAKLGIYFLMEHMGRRRAQVITLFMTGVCIGVAACSPDSLPILRTTVAIVGKGFSEATFTALFLYTAELFPTVLRQNGIGYTSFVGRLGASVAPLALLLDDVWHLMPETIFCSTALICSLVACLLPETLDVHLPETIHDVENGRSSNQQKTGASPMTELSLNSWHHTDGQLPPDQADQKTTVTTPDDQHLPEELTSRRLAPPR